MSRRRRRIVLGIVAVLALAAGLVAWVIDRGLHPTIEVEVANQSGFEVEALVVQADGFRLDVAKFPAQGRMKARVRLVKGFYVWVRCRRPDGRVIAGDSAIAIPITGGYRRFKAARVTIYEDCVRFGIESSPQNWPSRLWDWLWGRRRPASLSVNF